MVSVTHYSKHCGQAGENVNVVCTLETVNTWRNAACIVCVCVLPLYSCVSVDNKLLL